MEQTPLPNYITYQAKLAEKRLEYGGVYTFLFRTKEPLPYEAGQYVHVRIPSLPEGRRTREFSFASAPEESDLLFSMHMDTGSEYKRALDELGIGGTVELFKIKGSLTLTAHAGEQLILIAGGIGVTPFRSLLLHIVKSNAAVSPILVHVGNTFLYEQELNVLPFVQHRIARNQVEETLLAITNANPNGIYFIVGMTPFVESVRASLASMGIDSLQMNSDEFKGYTSSF